jgi:hypothetical protein
MGTQNTSTSTSTESCAACKVIINNLTSGLSSSLEQVVTSPLVRGPMISDADSNKYLQRLADIDIRSYTGYGADGDSLLSIVKDLEAQGVFTNEVWRILNPSP